ncbi:sulfotransferase family cytosolic 1B member 1-like [Plectropomus leopardus]|uniref:sulfotransferase family cytosolic 1B member 1-like n=1 Tax=Plectropomus leopardus TaxID=160734 RepID=UPI001C4D56C5|nr:sulfotransferase family cytosolic 1B member 1-like [Plectropomus leopardus]
MPMEEKELSHSGDHRPPLILVRGVPLENWTAKNLDSVMAFRPDPSDILIATYPKAGTTWTQEIVDLLLHKGDAEACGRAPTHIRSPFLESAFPPPSPSGLDHLRNMDPPRFIKTHLPFQLLPSGFWENNCKVIYVARNAKDNMVSYYHFDRMNMFHPEPGPWEEYMTKFMQGQLAWGSWYDHVKGYWMEREKKNILYLFYEDMKENPRREVERIMRYLDLSVSDEVISRIVELTSFKSMKENKMANYSWKPATVFDQSISPFMRKGAPPVGDPPPKPPPSTQGGCTAMNNVTQRGGGHRACVEEKKERGSSASSLTTPFSSHSPPLRLFTQPPRCRPHCRRSERDEEERGTERQRERDEGWGAAWMYKNMRGECVAER